MAIKITDNFQVNIKNPIDNRFVVGSQSIPGGVGSIYPTPFYQYRDDISSNMGFVYPGLRIWDFNDNLPYVWTGTTWSNENLTGASVLDSGTPGFSLGGGYRNYITKFYDTSTVLTKSLLFDNNENVSLDDEFGGTILVNPNSSGGAGTPPLNTLPGSIKSGLHVKGRIRTNAGFVGSGSYIHNINAANINGGPASGSPGRLALQWISTSGTLATTNPTTMYVLTNNNGGITSWQNILNVAPLYTPTNLGTVNSLNGSLAVSLFSGTNGLNHEFFSLISSGLQIDPGVNGAGSIRIESKSAVNVGGGSASIYKGLDGNKIHEFKTINSNFMNITQTSDVINLNSNITSNTLQVNPNGPHGITIEVPSTFEGTDYYVNAAYPGIEELGTRSKPFREIKTCLDKILNRPNNSIVPPIIPNPAINSGNPIDKWQNTQATRIVIQSFLYVEENLAINNVTYFLERGGYSSHLFIPDTPAGNNLQWMFDMMPLVQGARLPSGLLPYQISCKIEGSGTLTIHGLHATRKGFFRSVGSNSFDYNNTLVTTFTQEPGCFLNVGSVGGSILLQMDILPQGVDISQGVTPPPNKVVRLTIKFNNNPSNLSRFTYDIVITPSTPVFGGTYSNQAMSNFTFDKKFNNALNVNDVDECPLGSSSAITLSNLKSNLELFNRDPYIEYSINTSLLELYIDLTTLNSNSVTRVSSTLGTTNLTFPAPSNGLPITPSTTINYITLTDEDNNQIFREGTGMLGHKTTFIPDYGAIQVEGRNLPYHESLTLSGTIQVNCFEQHMIYVKNYGSIYSEDGRIYMRRNYQRVLYSKVKYIASSWDNNILYTGGNQWYEIVTLGSTTNWHLLGLPGSWRLSDGTPLTTPPNNGAVKIGYIFKRSSVAPSPSGANHGLVQSTRKMYLPCNHVYDIYLKDGGNINYGGDFYTQQNTGQNAGGADSFLFLENHITYNTYDRYNWRMCSFSANNGGAVTNLFYNSYIKVSYNVLHNNPDISHQVNFRSLKLNSQIWSYLIYAINSTGASVKFTLYGFNIIDTYMADVYWYGDKRVPFSNISIKPGLLFVGGTDIQLSYGTSFNTTIPEFAGNTIAKSYLSIGMFYRETSTGNLKVVY